MQIDVVSLSLNLRFGAKRKQRLKGILISYQLRKRVLAEHDKGKKHQAIVAARQRYEYSQLSSIYVSRIKQEHNDEQLKNYFSQFGSINNCFMDKEKHVYAIIEYENLESVERCLAFRNEHKIQNDRLKVKARAQHPFQAKKMILSKQEFLKLNKDTEIEKHTQMVHALNKCSTVEEQAKLVVEYEKMADVDFRQREQFYLELQNLFSKHFHGSKLHLTGSMANGLATVLSDMDLVLVLNDTYIEPQPYHQSFSSDDSIRSLINSNTNAENSNESEMDVENGNEIPAVRNNSSSNEASSSRSSPLSVIYSANELLQQSVADRLDYIGRLLRSHAPYVCHIQRICHARCPLVRFCHKQQKLFCELSINNHLAICNTELIRLYLELEPNLRLLLYTVRLWTKQKDLFGKGTRFNTYTLFWMLVFVLQQEQRLPSVSMLVQLSANQRTHGPWNCSVPDVNQVKSVFQSVSDCTLEQMLQSFFSYYSSLDSAKYSVSVWSGVNSEGQQQPLSGPILLVQDPFEHSHNLSSHVSASNWLKFQQECQSAVQILTDYNRKRLNKAWGWCLLFTRKTLPESNFKKKKNQTNDDEMKE
ncbi:unnamed protein product [Didymodactylos carnosus]|uniref:RRM domain-containing protein n=1 Tax=Didymodactylos carnosus TaxID=1234261 RepID=A0A814IC53_9BILA|nr:unnamed protein product [Didymodactylos carnosus]CAF3791204.1 unnamed protein product [Didymodactylos carnosus]